MLTFMLRIFFLFTLSLLIHTQAIANEIPQMLIPRKILFGNPDITAVKLSPHGNYISYLAPKDGVLNLFVADRTNPSTAHPVTNDKGSGIRSYFWPYDEKHILYLQDNDGDENFCLYAYNFETKKTTLLTPKNGVKVGMIKTSKNKPNEILVGLNERKKEYFDVYRLSLLDYKKELLIENDKFSHFITDNSLNIRLGSYVNEEGDNEYLQLKEGTWSPFMKINFEDSVNTGIMGFDKTGNVVYLTDSRGYDKAVLKTLDLKTNKEKIIASDKRADVDLASIHPTEYNMQLAEIEYDKKIYKVLDKSIKKDIDYLRSIATGQLVINSRTLDDKFWLIAYYSDVKPAHYYLYDRERNEAKFLFSGRKEIEKYDLSPMEPVIIKSRDGLKLVSYLTLPKKSALNEKSPLVLFVHGGPHVRDSWGINPVHQWLADRGYAVLSVNYRGSTGFGKDFVNKGYGQWGRKMHDDLIDSVNWAIKRKIADPKKICIMGGSYGGYATLAGLTFTPDVFACGVDIVGPSNLITLLETFPPYWKPFENALKKRIGSIYTEEGREDLRERSPLTYASNIKKPLLIAQGKNDPRVKQAESDQIVNSMKSNNIPVIYALYINEGHGFAVPENRMSFYAITEQFLEKILGGNAEPIESGFRNDNLILNDNKKVTDEYISKIMTENIIVN